MRVRYYAMHMCALVCMCVCVSLCVGEVEYFAPGRTGGWRVVARYRVHDDSDGISALLGLPGGACVTAAGANQHTHTHTHGAQHPVCMLCKAD